jgi:superfamily II DNA or RNA helicase
MRIQNPSDGWGSVSPRAWQQQCLEKVLLGHYSCEKPCPAAIRAVMGSGKSVLLAQMAACCQLEQNEVVVCSTSSIRLVEQLKKTFQERLEGAGTGVLFKGQKVGTYYTHGKDIHTPVIITCMPSVPELADNLRKVGKKVALWMADEAHRTQTAKVLMASSVLQAERILGVTATPFRADEKQSLTLFDKLLFDYGPNQALQDGVVVQFRIHPWEGGDANIDDASYQMTKNAVGPGLYSAHNIMDAENFVKFLREKGVRADCVHSKMAKADVERNIESLRVGRLQSLVHVNMLSEGADFPWLMWLCLRRTVGSRVRFIQESGRVLRSCDKPIWESLKKDHADIFDPNGLFDEKRLTYEAALGGEFEVDEADEEEDFATKASKALDRSALQMMQDLCDLKSRKEPISVTPLAGYLRELVTAFDVCHLLDNRMIAGRSWRQQPCSEKQLGTINNMGWTIKELSCVPGMHKQALGILAGNTGALNRGVASDLLSIMFSLSRNKKWPTLKLLDKSAESGMERQSKGQKNETQKTQVFTPPALPMDGKPHLPTLGKPKPLGTPKASQILPLFAQAIPAQAVCDEVSLF